MPITEGLLAADTAERSKPLIQLQMLNCYLGFGEDTKQTLAVFPFFFPAKFK